MALADNLEAAWELANVNDSHGANHLTNNNGVTFVAGGISGNAAFLEAASNQSLSIADNASLSTGDIDFSLDFWVNLTTKAATQDLIAKLSASTEAATSEYVLRYNEPTDRFIWVVSTGAGFGVLTCNVFGAPPVDDWIHVHVWHDAANNLIGASINDVAETPVAHASGPSGTTGAFAVGKSGTDPFNFADAHIDQVFFFKRLLTGPEQTFMNDGKSYAQVLAGIPVAGAYTRPRVFGDYYRNQN